MLERLDSVDWADVSHAYGAAADTPDLLRQAASDDPVAVSEAVSDLYGSVFHQGTVYQATVTVVPFLVELALGAPQKRADFLWFLGMLADEHHAYGRAFPAVRAAVREHSVLLVPLVEDADAEVREAAVYAACRAGVPSEVFWARWAVEGVPAVRASLALALGEVDIEIAAAVLAGECLAGPAPVRLAAVEALQRAGRAWPDGAVDELVTALDEGASITYCWSHGSDWYTELVTAPSDQSAVAVLEQMLRSENPETRRKGVYSLGERCDERRSAPVLLLPMLAGALHDQDADVRRDALWAVRRGGEASRQYADLLADLAAGYPAVAGDEVVTGEYMAVQTLARLADPRWVAPVCQAVTAGHRPVHLLDGARFSTGVLDEVRRGLAAQPVTANILSYALVEWGEQASAAAPELAAAVPVADPIVASALLALGHDTPDATALLRDRVESLGNFGAALAIHRVTGDAVPMLDLLRAILSGGRSRFFADAVSMSALSELGQILTPLMPTATTHLTGVAARTYPQRDAQILAARVVAAAGDPESVLPTVAAVLAGGGTSARIAADLIADLGRARPSLVEDLEPLLRARLDDEWSQIAAARALVRIGAPVGELTTSLVQGVTDYKGRFGLAAIIELRAVDTIAGLEALLASDTRFKPTSFADGIVWADELLQDRVRSAIGDLRSSESAR